MATTVAAAAAAAAVAGPHGAGSSPGLKTSVLPVSISDVGTFKFTNGKSFLRPWRLEVADTESGRNLTHAVTRLQTASSPVAFPTETVYGLAADATSSKAVQGIYKAKNRPADNPLIVHFCHLEQLRTFLKSSDTDNEDPIPKIYHQLISRFWPGPLTILLPLPSPSPLAPEVTNSLRTFGARLPSSTLALALIQQTGRPLAAPSANASTRPSPTTAQHVLEDMEGRIEVILDGGPCDVGVESTVVDGMSDPPCVLRPGGISIEELRLCAGWENATNGYERSERSHESKEKGGNPENDLGNGQAVQSVDEAPRAPGMKYRHYAPRAQVILVQGGKWHTLPDLIRECRSSNKRCIGILSTREKSGLNEAIDIQCGLQSNGISPAHSTNGVSEKLYEAYIGPGILDVSRGLFGALRELDSLGVEAIFVQGREADEGQTAAAVVNRLRKAAEVMV